MKIGIVENEEAFRIRLQEEFLGKEELYIWRNAEECYRDENLHKLDILLVDIGLPHMSGIDLIKLVKEKLPDLILCDVMMPEKDGLTTLKELKADESTKGIPVIMLSNLADQKYVDEALEVGAVSYLFTT